MILVIAYAWYGGPQQIGIGGGTTLTHVGQKVCEISENKDPKDTADYIFKTRFESKAQTTSEIRDIMITGVENDSIILSAMSLEWLKKVQSYLTENINQFVEQKKEQEA